MKRIVIIKWVKTETAYTNGWNAESLNKSNIVTFFFILEMCADGIRCPVFGQSICF